MMTALATVAKVQPVKSGYQVELSCEQQTSCNSCSSQKSCGTGIVTKAVGNKTLSWRLSTLQPVQAGQVVEIGFPEKSLLKSAFIVYLVPLFSLFIGAFIAHSLLAPMLHTGEGTTILFSAMFTGLGILLAKKLSHHMEKEAERDVVLVRILGEPIS